LKEVPASFVTKSECSLFWTGGQMSDSGCCICILGSWKSKVTYYDKKKKKALDWNSNAEEDIKLFVMAKEEEKASKVTPGINLEKNLIYIVWQLAKRKEGKPDFDSEHVHPQSRKHSKWH
jgi:hypothetical protein